MIHPPDDGRLGRDGPALDGCFVTCVHDEIQALSCIKSQDIDLVLLFLSVADTLAMDLTNVLRKISPNLYLPVVIVAPDPSEQLSCVYLDSGADDIVARTISQEQLFARIGALLRVKRLYDRLAGSRAALVDVLRQERNLLMELRKKNEDLQVLCRTDPLTHTQNLRSFNGMLAHEFKIAKRYNQPLSLLMLDVDHFKAVNDDYGHPSGDYVLKELAVIFKQSVRESDMVARTGGEEFSIVLPRAGLHQAHQFAERIRSETSVRKFIVCGGNIHITLSIGVACYPLDAYIVEPQMLVHFADQALLIAKSTGRDRVMAFHDLDAAVRQRIFAQYREHDSLVTMDYDEPAPQPIIARRA